MSVDLPPPETPVMQVKVPSGISAVTFFRLLPRAPDDLQHPALLRLAPLGRHGHREFAGEILAGQRVRVGHDLGGRALGDDLAAVDAGAGADIDDVIRLRIASSSCSTTMTRVAEVAQALQRLQAGARCRAGADRSKARRAHRARPSGQTDLAMQGGCAGFRRPTACRRRAPR